MMLAMSCMCHTRTHARRQAHRHAHTQTNAHRQTHRERCRHHTDKDTMHPHTGGDAACRHCSCAVGVTALPQFLLYIELPYEDLSGIMILYLVHLMLALTQMFIDRQDPIQTHLTVQLWTCQEMATATRESRKPKLNVDSTRTSPLLCSPEASYWVTAELINGASSLS